MNPKIIISMSIIMIAIMIMPIVGPSGLATGAKKGDGNSSIAKQIEADTTVVGQVDEHLMNVLNSFEPPLDRSVETAVLNRLYDLAGTAYRIISSLELYLDINDSTRPGTDASAGGMDAEIDLMRLTNGDASQLDTLEHQLENAEASIKTVLMDANSVGMLKEEPIQDEMMFLYKEACGIQNEIQNFLKIIGFPYGFLNDCEPHSPILIDGNSDFTASNGVTNGSGAPDDPYIISGWKIDTATANGIEIIDTYAYFIIRNVCIEYGGTADPIHSGVCLRNTANGVVELSVVRNNYYGIYVSESNGIRIEQCHVHNNNAYGIFILDSPSSVIEGNTVTNNIDAGITLRLSDDSVIANNVVNSNDGYGTGIRESEGVTVCFNNIRKNAEAGVMLGVTEHIDIKNNNVTENDEHGISLFDSNDILIKNNLIDSNGQNGVSIGVDNSDIDIEGNTISGNGVSAITGSGISTVRSDHIKISNNVISGNLGIGINIGVDSSSLSILGNEIDSNVGPDNIQGIVIVSSTDILIACNNITEHHPSESMIVVISMVGVHLTPTATGIKVRHNNFINNAWQAQDQGSGNSWDGGYPSGGNFWSEYSDCYDWSSPCGSDTKKGPDQDIAGSDGIGDTPYLIDYGQKDRYPLIMPVDTSECVSSMISLKSSTFLLQKLNATSKTLTQLQSNLNSTFLNRFIIPTRETENALRGLRAEANIIVARITLYFDDRYSYQMTAIPARPSGDDDGGVGTIDNTRSDTTESAANRLEVYTNIIARIDARLAAALDGIGSTPDRSVKDALYSLRDAAHMIIIRITSYLDNTYPAAQ